MRRNGFTLIEILIVVLIIGILLGVAVPQWMRAREAARGKACVDNLRLIDGAKEQWAMENRKGAGDAVVEADLWPHYLKGNAFPTCAGGGAYTIGTIGQPPQCSLHGFW